MPLDDPLVLLAGIGFIAFTVTSYFNYRIYRKLQNKGETTLEYLFLRGEIKRALEVLIISILIFLATSIITVIAIEMNMLVLSQAIRAGTAVLFIAYTGFFTALAIYTRPEKLQRK